MALGQKTLPPKSYIGKTKNKPKPVVPRSFHFDPKPYYDFNTSVFLRKVSLERPQPRTVWKVRFDGLSNLKPSGQEPSYPSGMKQTQNLLILFKGKQIPNPSKQNDDSNQKQTPAKTTNTTNTNTYDKTPARNNNQNKTNRSISICL